MRAGGRDAACGWRLRDAVAPRWNVHKNAPTAPSPLLKMLTRRHMVKNSPSVSPLKGWEDSFITTRTVPPEQNSNMRSLLLLCLASLAIATESVLGDDVGSTAPEGSNAPEGTEDFEYVSLTHLYWL